MPKLTTATDILPLNILDLWLVCFRTKGANSKAQALSEKQVIRFSERASSRYESCQFVSQTRNHQHDFLFQKWHSKYGSMEVSKAKRLWDMASKGALDVLRLKETLTANF